MLALTNAIRASLIADTQLMALVTGVYYRDPPRELKNGTETLVKPPWALLWEASAVPFYAMGSSESFRYLTYGIKGVAPKGGGKSAYAITEAIKERVYAVLQDSENAMEVDGWTVLNCRYLRDVPAYDDRIGDLQILHNGAMWEFHLERND